MSKYFFIPYLFPFIFFIIFLAFKFKEKRIQTLCWFALLPPFIANFVVLYFYIIEPNTSFTNLSTHLPNHFISIKLFEIDIGAQHHHFGFSLFIDQLSLIVIFLTSYLSIIVARLSHTYLHREPGYQRFYRTIFLFITGMYLIGLAGNLDLFFAGWELVGFSSFLLIAFYRNRSQPVKNAFRIYSIYRFADTGLLLSAIAGHVISKNADHFEILAQGKSILENVDNPMWLTFLGFAVLLSAIGKSGQFPFLNWPARAMEGPTPSSAIFYGALSIHCGVILLLRTYGLWKSSEAVVISICVIGGLSTVLASGIGRIQSNIKGRIAYATVAQIGIMFIEVALGFHQLVLFHILAHSLLRCYQLLISPSVIVETIKVLNRNVTNQSSFSFESYLPERIKVTLYNFAFQEAFLSVSERGFFFVSLIKWKLFFRRIMFSSWTSVVFISVLAVQSLLIGPINSFRVFAYVFAGLDVIISIQCLLSLEHPKVIWKKFLGSQFSFLISIYLVNPESLTGVWLYSISAIPCWILGYIALRKLDNPNMKIYNGFYITSPKRAHYMFLSFIGFAGLPLTTIFWAEDILLGQIFLIDPEILFLTTLSLMLNGLIVARVLVKTFWGFPTYVKI